MGRINNICRYLELRGLDAIVLPRGGDAEYLLHNDSLNWTEVLMVSKRGIAFRISNHDIVKAYAEAGEPTDELMTEGVVLVNAKGDIPAALSQIAAQHGIVRVGYEGHEVRAPLFRLLLAARGIELTDVGREDTEMFRRLKDDEEIALITKAQRITEAALEELLQYIKPGVTENELSARLLAGIISRGAEGKSCLLLASGARTGETHSRASDKRIEPGDLIQFDIGAVYHGYCSDMSRVVAVGSVTDEQRRIYDLVLEAQEAGINAFVPGTLGRDMHSAALRVFERQGLGEFFTHGLGHNVGRLIHEGPYASPDGDEPFETGHICTIEPGLYFKNRFGIRIEDMLWLSPNGRVDLTDTTKELRILS